MRSAIIVLVIILFNTLSGSNIVVSSQADNGTGTIRWAIETANLNPGPDTITFAISGTIQPVTGLPDITDDKTIILGETAPGGNHLIVIDGGLTSSEDGLVLNSNSNLLSGLVINNFDLNAISIQGNDNVVAGCYLNVTSDGLDWVYSNGSGIYIDGYRNQIGGINPDEKNVITGGNGIEVVGDTNKVINNYIGIATNGMGFASPFGSSVGVYLLGDWNSIGEMGYLPNYFGGWGGAIYVSSHNVIDNNVIGLGTDSMTVIGNGDGIRIFGHNNIIGTSNGGNLISGNYEAVFLDWIEADSNCVYGNIIRGNAQNGVYLLGEYGWPDGPCHNKIGGLEEGMGNYIENNGYYGVHLLWAADSNVIAGNIIGSNDDGTGNNLGGIAIFTDNNIIDSNQISYNNEFGIGFTGNRNIYSRNTIFENSDYGIIADPETGIGNTFTENIIYNHDVLGIDLNHDGVTPNDPGDSDTGPNDLLNFPEIDSIQTNIDSSFTIFGHMSDTGYVEYFIAHPAGQDTQPVHTSGHGEAYYYIGRDTALTDGPFIFDISNIYPFYTVITAIATDTLGNTSEFSENFMLIPGPLIIVAYGPVNILITDPEGRQYGKLADGTLVDELNLGAAEYHEITNDSLIIFDPIYGVYNIQIITEDEAAGDEVYSADWMIGDIVLLNIAANLIVPPLGESDVYEYAMMESSQYAAGDANGDGSVNIADASYIVNAIFFGGNQPDPIEAADANCDGTMNIADASYIINWIFFGGDPPCGGGII